MNVYPGVKTGIEENQNKSFYGERSRGPERTNGLPNLHIWVAEPILVSKSPDSKFKPSLLYPFFQITKQGYTK